MLRDNRRYQRQLKDCARQPLDWNRLNNKKILITGGTGLIGSFLADILLLRRQMYGQSLSLSLMGRNPQEFRKKWGVDEISGLSFVRQDICEPFAQKYGEGADYLLHLASNTYPAQYAGDPIGTVMTNTLGTKNVLDYGSAFGTERCVFASSVEIYGENRGDITYFTEDYCGYLDCSRLRSGYPESKRAGEAICQAYIEAKGMDIVIPRIGRVYGPGMQTSDNRAISQFIKAAAEGRDIVLKSSGSQRYSFLYAADAAMAILYLLLNGENGGAYNVAGEDSGKTLKDIALLCADYAGTRVVQEVASLTKGYSGAEKGLMDTGKLNTIGWKSLYSLQDGICSAIDILREDKEEGGI